MLVDILLVFLAVKAICTIYSAVRLAAEVKIIDMADALR